MTAPVQLPGLNGTNPLGLFAALGALDVVTRAEPTAQPTLRWEGELTPRPVLGGCGHFDELVEMILADRDGWRESVALNGHGPDMPKDIKPRPGDVADWFRAAISSAHDGDLPLLHALISEGALAGKGDSKPTHLHFTAGNQMFLVMARELRDRLTESHLREALAGPWTYESELPVLGWDNNRSERLHALSRQSPSGTKKRGVPGAEWLALLGLRFFPVATTDRHELVTTACAKAWKSGGHLTWPLWEQDLAASEIAPLLTEGTESMTARQRRARGISAVLRAPIRRADQGGYGSFGPTSPVPPPQSM
ncbi:MAG: hypothetical protein R2754_18730 [Microthrixaceae bacterium]